MRKSGLASLLITALAVVTYLVVTSVNLGTGIKWWVFGCHLVLAVGGLVIGLLAVFLRQWWGSISVGVCAYFLWIQFGGMILRW